MDYSIAFPNLGIFLSYVPKSFTIFGYTVALYGVTMALSMLAGLWLVTSWARRLGQSPDLYLDLAMVTIVFALIGARAYYVIFSWDFYGSHPREILNFRAGGLALYGAVIGGSLTIFVFARVRRQKVTLLLDTVCLGMLTGQIIGRWGNFFNREAFGTYTDGLLAMALPLSAVREREIPEICLERSYVRDGVSYILVHPTFLYESLWNLGVLLILLTVTGRAMKKFDGEICLLYFLLYGSGRVWIEALRTDQLRLPGTELAVSQLLSACLMAGSLILIFCGRRRARRIQ